MASASRVLVTGADGFTGRHLCARLRAAGFDVTDPEDQEWGSRHAWFRDADGRPISIYTPIDQGG